MHLPTEDRSYCTVKIALGQYLRFLEAPFLQIAVKSGIHMSVNVK